MKSSLKRTGIVYDQRYVDHCTGPGHPECPERLAVIHAMLQAPDMQGPFEVVMPRSASRQELLQVHSEGYVRRLEETEGQDVTRLDADTQTSPLSHGAALLAAGGLCRSIERVQAGELDNAFALVRPPGHHAERSKAGGFCLYNNVAVGTRFAQNHLGLRRILVVDWDLHFGNGTQHCFEDDPSVLFFSIHQAFTFPGGGGFKQIGKGRGRGFSVNIPLAPGYGDAEYTALFETLLKPIALEFDPEFILVSAGFDAHHEDGSGGMTLTPRGFAAMTRSVLNIAEHCCGGKLVLVLEGGYHLEGLRESARAVLRELSGLETTDIGTLMSAADPKKLKYIIWRIGRIHGGQWQSLKRPSAEGLTAELSIWERLREGLKRIRVYFKS